MSEPLSPELEAKAQELAARITARSADAILEMARRLVATTDDTLFGDTEFALRDRGPRPRRRCLRLPPPPKSGYTTSAIDCPRCGRRASFHGHREKTVETLGGPVTCNRAYYYCGLCATGSCPWDRRVGLTAQRLSPAVERLATLCGAVADSLEKGTELLKETAGIRLGESTVQRTTEAAGDRIAALLHLGRTFGGKGAWDWFRDACGRTVGYIGIGATGVRQQGPHGEAADGRMAYVGMIFNPRPDPERAFEGRPEPGMSMKARYVSGLYPPAEMGPLLRRRGGAGRSGSGRRVGGVDRRGRGAGGLRARELPARGGGDPGLLSRGGISGEVGECVTPDGRGRGRGRGVGADAGVVAPVARRGRARDDRGAGELGVAEAEGVGGGA